MCSLVTCNNWPRVISNHRKLTCIKCFCSSKSVMLARLLLREHFQILGSYFLPHTNTVILLDSHCLWYYQRDWSFFSWAPKLHRKCESKHWFPCGAYGRSFVRSINGQVITKFSGMGRFIYPWCSAGAPESSANQN